jgi:hypothetical protein
MAMGAFKREVNLASTEVSLLYVILLIKSLALAVQACT